MLIIRNNWHVSACWFTHCAQALVRIWSARIRAEASVVQYEFVKANLFIGCFHDTEIEFTQSVIARVQWNESSRKPHNNDLIISFVFVFYLFFTAVHRWYGSCLFKGRLDSVNWRVEYSSVGSVSKYYAGKRANRIVNEMWIKIGTDCFHFHNRFAYESGWSKSILQSPCPQSLLQTRMQWILHSEDAFDAITYMRITHCVTSRTIARFLFPTKLRRKIPSCEKSNAPESKKCDIERQMGEPRV